MSCIFASTNNNNNNNNNMTQVIKSSEKKAKQAKKIFNSKYRKGINYLKLIDIINQNK